MLRHFSHSVVGIGLLCIGGFVLLELADYGVRYVLWDGKSEFPREGFGSDVLVFANYSVNIIALGLLIQFTQGMTRVARMSIILLEVTFIFVATQIAAYQYVVGTGIDTL